MANTSILANITASINVEDLIFVTIIWIFLLSVTLKY